MKPMKKIVLSAIAALVVTVGVYQVALFMGASESSAAATIAIAAAFTAIAFTFAAIAAAAFTFTAIAAAAFTFTAIAAIAAAAFAAIPAFIAIVFAAIAAVFAFVVAEQEHIRFRWVALAYVLEGLAIWGALAVGNPAWSITIALAGIAAQLALWHAHSRFAAVDGSPTAPALPDHNGA